ncbi:MAG: aldo/keto reductase [Chloroflexaceae bacterium]|nr:aldo/keto reductase [Chloroflexaceae bacterium]
MQNVLRQLGATGLVVSPLGLGLAALGRPGYINLGHAADLQHEYDVAAMQARTHAVLDAAWAAGVRYFDAARSYGRGEAFLGAWLAQRQLNPPTFTVGSKWGYTYTAAWQVHADQHEVKSHTLPVLRQQWHESYSILGPSLRLYQIHSATLESGVLERDEVLRELAHLKAQGVAIGLSVSGPQQAQVIERALSVQVDGVALFDTVQATWNVLEPSAGASLQAAHQAGLGVIIKEALANGRLTARNTRPADAALVQCLMAEAERRHTTADALALAAVLAQPFVSVVLSGAATVAQLHANLGALAVAYDAPVAAAFAPYQERAPEYWHIRSSLAWN